MPPSPTASPDPPAHLPAGGPAVPGPAARRRVFDAHLHIVDPRFPLTVNQGYLPPTFTVADYLARVASVGVTGGAVVSGSFQSFDPAHLLDALHRLGPGFVGVTHLRADVADHTIRELDAAGVRAIRFNVRRGGSAALEGLDRLARRVYELAGWHAELYLDARDLPDLAPMLTALPKVSIDHLGLSREGLPHLLRLVERGAHVKATGFGRVDLDVPATLRAVAAVSPRALLAGTDLPSTRAPRPFRDADLDVIAEAVGVDLAPAVMHDNARALYRPIKIQAPGSG
ncbi:amidohydrolase family protein [Embleya sp. NPDC127516]|uniref:amidohydrolase family protein n=1 Tax=Embleya sp. NPDC127516 TaxID=3363990 RepID=UPI00380B6F11